MVNMSGQKFQCTLPELPEFTSDEENLNVDEVDIAKLLSPLESAPCIFLTKDWWTYQVCYNRYV